MARKKEKPLRWNYERIPATVGETLAQHLVRVLEQGREDADFRAALEAKKAQLRERGILPVPEERRAV